MDIKKAIKEMKSLSPSENAIETVLQKIEKQQEQINELKTNSISKKKIEDKIEELDDEFNNYQVDVNCTQDGYYIYSNEYAFVKETLQKLLEDK